MSENLFKTLLIPTAALFVLIFSIVVIPASIAEPDIVNFFASGFVNPFASGYSADVVLCWVVLCIWIIYEALNKEVKYGWICLLLGIVPGVAVGFSLYLLVRHTQIKECGAETP